MTTMTPALSIDETTTLDINGSRQRVRLCAARPGLPPLLIVQHGPGVPVLHEVAKFQRRLQLERSPTLLIWTRARATLQSMHSSTSRCVAAARVARVER